MISKRSAFTFLFIFLLVPLLGQGFNRFKFKPPLSLAELTKKLINSIQPLNDLKPGAKVGIKAENGGPLFLAADGFLRVAVQPTSSMDLFEIQPGAELKAVVTEDSLAKEDTENALRRMNKLRITKFDPERAKVRGFAADLRLKRKDLQFSIKAPNGKFLTIDDADKIQATAETVGEKETFALLPQSGGEIMIIAPNGFFLSVTLDGTLEAIKAQLFDGEKLLPFFQFKKLPTPGTLLNPGRPENVGPLYQGVLQRSPTAKEIKLGTKAMQDTYGERQDWYADFLNSEEARRKLDDVDRLYLGSLQRFPSDKERQEAEALLEKGVVTQELKIRIPFGGKNKAKTIRIPIPAFAFLKRELTRSEEFWTLQVNSLYWTYFQRLGTAAELEGYAKKLSEHTMGLEQVSDEMLGTEESTKRYNIIQIAFLDLLDRLPTKAEEEDFSKKLKMAEMGIRAKHSIAWGNKKKDKFDPDKNKEDAEELARGLKRAMYQAVQATDEYRTRFFLAPTFQELLGRSPNAAEEKMYLELISKKEFSREELRKDLVGTNEYRNKELKEAEEVARQKVLSHLAQVALEMRSKADQEATQAAKKAQADMLKELAEKQEKSRKDRENEGRDSKNDHEKERVQFFANAKAATLKAWEIRKKSLKSISQGSLPRLFRDLLQREPSGSEYQTFQKKLNSGEMTLPQIRGELLKGAEFASLKNKRLQDIQRSYRIAFGRNPDAKQIQLLSDKLNKGEKTVAELKEEFSQEPEAKKIQKIRKSPLPPPKPTSETKKEIAAVTAEAKSKAGSDHVLILSEVKGFSAIPFADEVRISGCKVEEIEDNTYISGRVSLFGLQEVDSFATTYLDRYGKVGYILGVKFDKEYKLSQAIKNLPSGLKILVDLLVFNRGSILYSTTDYIVDSNHLMKPMVDFLTPAFTPKDGSPPDLFRMELDQGLNLFGALRLDSGILDSVRSAFAYTPKELLVNGVIGTKIFSGDLGALQIKGILATIPVPSWMPNACKSIQPIIELNGEPAVALSLTLKVGLPNNEKEPVDFQGKVVLPLGSNQTIEFVGCMNGTWEDPFGIEGLSIGDLVLKVVLGDPAFGLAGSFKIGDKEVLLSAKIPLGASAGGVGFRGTINELHLGDLVDLVGSMGGPVQTGDLPLDQIGFRDVDIAIAGKTDKDLGLMEGLTLKGKLDIIKKELGIVNIHVSKKLGITIQGSLKKLNLGPLELTGDGPDNKAGTEDDGPYVDAALTLSAAHFYLGGKVELLGISHEVQVVVAKSGLSFEFTDKIWKLYQANVLVAGGLNFKDPKFRVKAQLRSDFFGALENSVDVLTRDHTPAWAKAAFRNMFQVEKAGFEADLVDLKAGKSPTLSLVVSVLGMRKSFDMDYDFVDDSKSLAKLSEKCAKMVLEELKSLGEKLLQLAEDVAVKIKEKAELAARKIEETAEKLAEVAGEAARKAAEKVVDEVRKVAKEVVEKIKDLAEKAGKAIKNALDKLKFW
jgi:hypothetical protein